MAEILRYTTNTPSGPCEVCDALDGMEGTADELPLAPNPDCLNLYKCNCTLEVIGDDDDDLPDGCMCHRGCPDEWWDDLCDCDEAGGCCCIDESFDRWWSYDCDCDGDGDNGGGGGGECVIDDAGDCLAPCIWCEDLDGNWWCIDLFLCYSGDDGGI